MTPCNPEDFTVGQKVRLSEHGKKQGFGHGGGRFSSWSTGVVTSTDCRLPGCIRVRPNGSKVTRTFASYFWEPDGR